MTTPSTFRPPIVEYALNMERRPAVPYRRCGGLAMLLGLALVAGVASGATTPQDNAALVFIDVNVIPMDREQVLMRQTVVIQGDRIVAMGPSDEVSMPRRTRRVDGRGKYLIPGLVDAHAQLLSDGRIARRYAAEELAVTVANGVTTMRNPSGSAAMLEVRERISAGDLLGPTLYVGSPQLTATDLGRSTSSTLVQTPFEAAAAVRRLKGDGYDFLMLSSTISAEIYEGAILTARGMRFPVVGHVPAGVGLQRALDSAQQIEYLDQYLEALIDPGDEQPGAGLSGDGLWQRANWNMLDEVAPERVAAVVAATTDAEIWNTPTLAALNSFFGTGRSDDEIEASPDYRFISPSVRADLRADLERYWVDPPDERLRAKYVELRNRIVRELFEGGGKLMAGSSSPTGLALSGFGLHRELQSLVDAGLTPFAALWAATRSPASFLSWGTGGGRTEYATVQEGAIVFESAVTGEVDFGRVAVGRRADLVLLNANPLDDIANSRRIEGVVLRGRWLPRSELDRLLEESVGALSQAPLLGG